MAKRTTDSGGDAYMDNVFTCKGKCIAEYLVKHGSHLIEIALVDGVYTYIFEKDESIDKNLKDFEKAHKRCLF